MTTPAPARAAARALALIALIAVVGCQSRPAPDSDSAALELRVVAKPKAGAARGFPRVPVYDAAPSRAVTSGQFAQVDYGQLGDIVVWLSPEGEAAREAAPPAPPAPVELAFNPAAPSEAVHPVSVGQSVVVRNTGSASIAPYSVSDGNEFDLPEIAPGETAEFTVQSEGLIELLDDPDQPPVALLYAAPSPWVARAQSGKAVRFGDVPPGRYVANAWHPRLPGSSASVELPAGQVTRKSLAVGVDAMRDAERE